VAGVNALETPVVGIFYSATKAYDDRALRIPLAQAHILLRDKAVIAG
jgi:ABC-type lipoprotein release transport system permease subunit